MHLQTVTRKCAETCEIKHRNLFLCIAKQMSTQYLAFFKRFYENYAIPSPGNYRVYKYGNILFSKKIAVQKFLAGKSFLKIVTNKI